mmetsp:Transcript_96164/g.272250  ORF Transcript_96164/g.272250 Transcript_96164/m.272250 type:complete len:200 (+) Transcript_96164:481-1080(+)
MGFIAASRSVLSMPIVVCICENASSKACAFLSMTAWTSLPNSSRAKALCGALWASCFIVYRAVNVLSTEPIPIISFSSLKMSRASSAADTAFARDSSAAYTSARPFNIYASCFLSPSSLAISRADCAADKASSMSSASRYALNNKGYTAYSPFLFFCALYSASLPFTADSASCFSSIATLAFTTTCNASTTPSMFEMSS